MSASFSKLTKFPRHRLLEEELIRGRASELDLLALFGESTLQSAADDPDPSFFWDIEWSCELVMGLQFKQLTEVLSVRLDQPDTAHALRHLDFPLGDRWCMERDAPDQLARLAKPLDRSWSLWQEDDDGFAVLVELGLTRRNAECWCDELNGGFSNQYWVEKVA
jgi:hypothetical protein